MSRMLALRSPSPAAAPESVLLPFLALAEVHSDGWGCAGVDDDGGIESSTGLSDAAAGLCRAAAVPRRAALHYLRLASSASPVATENLQPFHDDGIAFMHNGALVPYSRGLEALSPDEQESLRGTSDSELYFAIVRRELRARRGTLRMRIERAVSHVRELYPQACLNAMMLVDDSLVAIASRGTVPAPLAALAARGETLGPAEAAAYNTLYCTRTDDGVDLLATSGIDTAGWDEIPDGEIVIL